MKRIITFFVLCVFFAGCTASGEPETPVTQTPTESQSEPETKAPDEESKPAEQSEPPETSDVVEIAGVVRTGVPEIVTSWSSENSEHITTKTTGTYEYRGIVFPGEYHDSRTTRDGKTTESTIFFFDRHYLLSDHNGGRALCQITNRAALAYIAGDYEKLSQYMCEEGGWVDYRIYTFDDDGHLVLCDTNEDNPTLELLLPYNVYTSIGGEYIVFLYFTVFEGRDFARYTGMDVYLDDDGEWKINHINMG